MREQLDKEGGEDDVERLEEGVRDGGHPAGAAGRLPGPWLARRLSADWKTCQVTLAPPTHPLNTPEFEPPPKTTSIFEWKLPTCCTPYSEVTDLARFGDPKKPASSSLSVLRAVRLITLDYAVTFKCWFAATESSPQHFSQVLHDTGLTFTSLTMNLTMPKSIASLTEVGLRKLCAVWSPSKL